MIQVAYQAVTSDRRQEKSLRINLPDMMRSEAPSRVKTRSTGVRRKLSAGT